MTIRAGVAHHTSDIRWSGTATDSFRRINSYVGRCNNAGMFEQYWHVHRLSWLECVIRSLYEEFDADSTLVGFGLTFGLNAAPLLITELAYPTQVSPCTFVEALSQYQHRITVTSVENLRPCTIHLGILVV